MASNDSNVISSGGTGASNGGGTSHRKLKGAAEVVHGIGENIRGRVLGAVDSSTSSDAAHPEVEHGSREIEHGLAKLTGGPGAARDGAGRSAARSASPSRTGPATSGRGGAAPGPASAITAGFNAGPDTALAEAPYQPSDAGSEDAAHFQGGRNDRDFHPGGGQEGSPAPDRSTLSGDPQRLG